MNSFFVLFFIVIFIFIFLILKIFVIIFFCLILILIHIIISIKFIHSISIFHNIMHSLDSISGILIVFKFVYIVFITRFFDTWVYHSLIVNIFNSMVYEL